MMPESPLSHPWGDSGRGLAHPPTQHHFLPWDKEVTEKNEFIARRFYDQVVFNERQCVGVPPMNGNERMQGTARRGAFPRGQ